MRRQGAEHPVVAMKPAKAGESQGGVCSEAASVGPTRKGRSLKDEAKPFCISRWEVWEACLKVKSNRGGAGLDGQSIEDFERDLKKNLYRIWNRMSSGSYYPPPVRTVKIPKANGGERTLGIPTVSDRIAQMAVKNRLEAVVDPLFLPASYGYRPGKPALDAVGQARQMCWAYNWVCDLDIKGFFGNLDHGLMMKAVRKHAQERWMVLYIERWLKAPAQDEQGNLLQRGYTFRPRVAYGRKGRIFCSFSPAISKKAEQKIRDEIRGWKLHRCTGQTIGDLARKINPELRGWFNYYGRFTPSALRPIERHVGQSLVRWVCRKYKKLRKPRSRAWAWLIGVLNRQPNLLALWEHQRSRFITIGAV